MTRLRAATYNQPAFTPFLPESAITQEVAARAAELQSRALKELSTVSDAEGLEAVGPAAATLARAEGLDAHALSVAIRLNRPRR